MNSDFKNDIYKLLDQNESDEASNFYKEHEVLIQGFTKVSKEFQNLREGNLFTEVKREELKHHIDQLTQLDFKLKRASTRIFTPKYASQINELIDFAKSSMLLSQAKATLAELEQILLNAQENEIEHKDPYEEEEKKIAKLKAEIEKKRLTLEIETEQLKNELSYFQDLQNAKIILENNEKLKEFRKTTFIDSVVNDWIDGFSMDVKFRTKSIGFYDELFSKQILSLRDIVNIPSNYGTTINSTNSTVLPLNFFIELEKLYLNRVNLCFLPSLILPKLKLLVIQDCYKGGELINARYSGVWHQFDLTDDWIKSFQRNNPKCHITITT